MLVQHWTASQAADPKTLQMAILSFADLEARRDSPIDSWAVLKVR